MSESPAGQFFDSATERAPWCPDKCPITQRSFFMWIEHPVDGVVPTYGGPYDSYTLPWFDGEDYVCQRYDHDEGGWPMDEYVSLGVQVVDDQLFITEEPPGPAVPNEKGQNRYGLDMQYFRALFNRELNRSLESYRPDELARVLARAARTACPQVLREAEFQKEAGVTMEQALEAVEAEPELSDDMPETMWEWMSQSKENAAFALRETVRETKAAIAQRLKSLDRGESKGDGGDE